MQRVFICITLLYLSINAFAQQSNTPTEPPFKRFPIVPPIKLLKTDSATIYQKSDIQKKKAIMIVIFSPDCDHCQHEAEDIMAHIDSFKKIQIIFSSLARLYEIKAFETKYGLAGHKNIIVGQDYNYLLNPFYELHNYPLIACYDKKQQLLTTFEGSYPIEKVLKHFE